jgi:hypothetical protein
MRPRIIESLPRGAVKNFGAKSWCGGAINEMRMQVGPQISRLVGFELTMDCCRMGVPLFAIMNRFSRLTPHRLQSNR